MKNEFIGCVAVVLGFTLSSCQIPPNKFVDSNDLKIERAQQELKHARTAYLLDWQKFKVDTEREVQLNNLRIDCINEIMANAGPKEIIDYKKRISDLLLLNRGLNQAMEEFTCNGYIGREKAIEPNRDELTAAVRDSSREIVAR